MNYRRHTTPVNRVTVEPSIEPVALEWVKQNAYIVADDSDDSFITQQLIPEARRMVERLACRSLITQTRAQYHDYLPCEEIVLRYGPVQSITSVAYMDSNNASQTMSSSLYTLDAKSIPGRLRRAYNQTWPSVADVNNAVTVTMVCGYGATGSSVPIIYRRAIIQLCTHWYNNRDQLGCVGDAMLEKLQHILAIEGMTVEYA